MQKRNQVIENKNRKKKNPTGRIAIVSIVLFLALVMATQMVRLYQKNQSYIAREEALEAELKEQQKKQEELIEYEIYTQAQE